MSTPGSAPVSRRAALTGFAVGGLGLALAGPRTGAAQDAPAGAAPPMRGGAWATVNGAELYYEDHGSADGQPVLLLHGGHGNTEEWNYVWPVLIGAGYRTVAMDCRGRGRSTWGDLPISYAQMALDAVGLLDHLGIARAHLVGHSDGAIIGLELAIAHGERLDRAVVYAANFTPDGFRAEPQMTDQVPPFEYFIAAYERLAPEPDRFDELNEILGAMWAVSPNYDATQLGSIAVPVLILDGEADEFVETDQPVRMAELIPGAELVLLPGTGHFAIAALPGAFNRVVLDFLDDGALATPTA